jgi:hypothetical protein
MPRAEVGPSSAAGSALAANVEVMGGTRATTAPTLLQRNDGLSGRRHSFEKDITALRRFRGGSSCGSRVSVTGAGSRPLNIRGSNAKNASVDTKSTIATKRSARGDNDEGCFPGTTEINLSPNPIGENIFSENESRQILCGVLQYVSSGNRWKRDGKDNIKYKINNLLTEKKTTTA